MICQAELVDIGLTGTGTDPFDATFLLAGTDPHGREIVVWIRLTPTMINDLIERLERCWSRNRTSWEPTVRAPPTRTRRHR